MAEHWQTILKQTFGFDHLRAGQQPVVEAVLAGRSAAAIFPTGSGKSLCYQLPALMLPNLTLVVSPLLALMQDQVDFLRSKGIAAASLDSTLSRDELQAVRQGVRNDEIRILFISVERLKNERFREFIRHVPISLLVVDEAHCISEWGHNFRPDYLTLPQWRRDNQIAQVLLLTATATESVITDMQRHFDIAPVDVVSTGFYRPNLRILIQPGIESERTQRCLDWLNHQASKETAFGSVIYVTQQQTADELANRLEAASPVVVESYHAGLGSDIRRDIQQRFMSGKTSCIVATIAFGMGIDKSDIRQVLHYDLPKSIENYSQEIGRAGRDGQAADCVMLADDSALETLENYTYGDTPSQQSIERLLGIMRKETRGNDWEFTLSALSSATDIRPLPLKTLLVYLELQGIISPRYSYYAEYRFRCEDNLPQRFQGERQDFIQQVLQLSGKGRVWYTLNSENLQQNFGDDGRMRAIRALEYCQEQGWLELESKQMTEVFRVSDTDVSNDHILTQSIYENFLTRQNADIMRLHKMLDMFRSQHCLTKQLSHYFADTSMKQNCGHCSVCIGRWRAWPTSTVAQLPSLDSILSALLPLRTACQKQYGVDVDAVMCTRYLCGLTSPWLTRLKVRKMTGYASLEKVPYATVMEAVKRAVSNDSLKVITN